MKIEIRKTLGKWLINGKTYDAISGEEKTFFDEFILSMRWQYECDQYDKRLKKVS